MNKMWAPVSVKRARFTVNKPSGAVVGLHYLLQHLKRVIVSDKYIMDRNVLVLDLTRGSCKRLLARAMDSIEPNNKVISINTLVRKGTARVFRGVAGTFTSYKRAYVRFEKEIDPKVFSNQTESEEI